MFKLLHKIAPKKTLYSWLAITIGVIALEIGLTLVIPYARKGLFDALEGRVLAVFLAAFAGYVGLLLALHIEKTVKEYIVPRASFFLRSVLTNYLYVLWRKSTVREGFSVPLTQGPQQATSLFFEVGIEIFISAGIVVSMIYQYSGQTKILVAGTISTTALMIFAFLFKKPLVRTERDWQNQEGLVREYIGDETKVQTTEGFQKSFDNLATSFNRFLNMRILFNSFGFSKTLFMTVAAYLLFLDEFFNQGLSLGSYMEKVSVFELLVVNASILVSLYPTLVKAIASQSLVEDFHDKVIENTVDNS